MKFVNVPEINKVALSLMIFSTCGEDVDTLANTVIEAETDNRYHVTYALEDSMNAMDFRVEVERIRNEYGTTTAFKYTVTDSVYADDGEFTLSIS